MATPFLEDVIEKSGATMVGDIADALPGPVMINSWGATREWAYAKPDIVTAFHDSMEEALDFIAAQPDQGHQAMIKTTGLKPEIVNRTPFSKIERDLNPDALAWWYSTIKARNQIVGDFDPATLVYQVK